MSHEVSLPDFEKYFPYTPAALCIKECARLKVLRSYPCPGPVLDVGCGDGLFAKVAFDDVEIWGIDIDAKEGRWASASRAYAQVILGDVTAARLPSEFFRTCVANCSLEHVPRIDLALQNIRASLVPGGRIYAFVPNRDWTQALLSSRLLTALGLSGLAETLRDSVDHVFKHHHLHDEAGWRRLFEEADLSVVAVEPVLSPATTVAFELCLVPSLLGWLNKRLTTRWTNFPPLRKKSAILVHAWIRALLTQKCPGPTAEYLVIAERSVGAAKPAG